MTEDTELIKKRLIELDSKSYSGEYYTFTNFLGLAEQAAFAEVQGKLKGRYTLFGGAREAERIVVRFGNSESIGYDVPFPIKCIKVEPRSMKFADKLTHRDFLGAILNLGIDRSTIGDIIIIDNVGYVFALEDIAPYIISELKRIKHTDVVLGEAEDLPECALYKTELRRVQAAGERIDAIAAKLYCISRDCSLSLFKKNLVFVNGKQCSNNSYSLKTGDKVSIRGYGRFIYRGYSSLSKKGKLNIDIEVYL